MTLSSNQKHDISLAEAKQLIQNYHNHYSEDPRKIISGFFGKDALVKLLNQDKCIGLRIYNAQGTDGKNCFVLVGVNEEQKDMTEGSILEFQIPCPPNCPVDSELIK